LEKLLPARRSDNFNKGLVNSTTFILCCVDQSTLCSLKDCLFSNRNQFFAKLSEFFYYYYSCSEISLPEIFDGSISKRLGVNYSKDIFGLVSSQMYRLNVPYLITCFELKISITVEPKGFYLLNGLFKSYKVIAI
jgi:hypothetical protein